jgi:hypothetical protein
MRAKLEKKNKKKQLALHGPGLWSGRTKSAKSVPGRWDDAMNVRRTNS